MHRRYLTKAGVGVAAAVVLGHHAVFADRATPAASPMAAQGTWAAAQRTYKRGETTSDTAPAFLSSVTVWIEYWSEERDARMRLARSRESVIRLSEGNHVTDDIEDAPTLGEESYAVRGGTEPSTEAVWVGFRVGGLVYTLGCFGDERDALAPFAFQTVAAIVERAAFRYTYAKDQLLALFPTEGEVGLAVVATNYESGEYTPKP